MRRQDLEHVIRAASAINHTHQNVGYCLEPHDLAASKLAAGREKDHDFVRALLRHRIVEHRVLEERIGALPLAPADRERLARWLSAEVARGSGVADSRTK